MNKEYVYIECITYFGCEVTGSSSSVSILLALTKQNQTQQNANKIY